MPDDNADSSVESGIESDDVSSNNESSKQTPDTVRNVLEQGEQMARRLPFIGHVTWLYSQSPAYRMLFIQDLEWRLFPAIMHDQCKLYIDRNAGQLPTAYASWALLSASAEQNYIASHKLAPSDWKSGDRLWLIDFLAPFGGTAHIFKDLRRVIPSDSEINLLYPDSSGTMAPVTLDQLTERLKTGVAPDSTEPDDNHKLH